MKEFDANKPENLKFKNYFQGKKCLIVSPFQNVRVMLRKLYLNLGVVSANIDLVNNYYEALELFNDKHHELIASEYLLDTKTEDESSKVTRKYGVDLLVEHKKLYPSRLDAIFIIISDNDSQNVLYKCFEEEVELFITKPISYSVIEAEFLEIAKKKIVPSSRVKVIERIKEAIANGQFDEAFKILDKLKSVESSSSESFYLEGLIHYQNKNLSDAASSFALGFDSSQKHYKLACSFFDVLFELQRYEEAYDIMQKMVEDFPINPIRIPRFVKVSIASGNHGDIEHFCEVFKELEDRNPVISKQIAVGLIISAKGYQSSNCNKKAIYNLTKAIDFSVEEKKLLLNSLSMLVELEAFTEVGKAISHIEEDGRMDNDFQVIKLQIILHEENFGEALTSGLSLINSGFRDPELYGICIQSSIKMGRKEGTVQEIVDDASSLYPDRKQYYESILKKVS